MKKTICAAVLVLAAAAAFAEGFSLSAGGGAVLGGTFTRYTLEARGGGTAITATQSMNQFNYGLFAFFDATYGVLGLFWQNGANTFDDRIEGGGGPDMSGNGWETVVGVSLLGRWPFRMNERLAVFPMLGIEYHVALNSRRTDEFGEVYDRTSGFPEADRHGDPFLRSDFDSLFVKLGGGADINVRGDFFFRGELLYGFRLMTGYERKNLDMIRHLSGDSSPRLGGLTSGPSVRLSAGLRLFTRERP